MKAAHLAPIAIAVLLICTVIYAGEYYVHSTEERYIHSLVNLDFDQKNVGSAFQRIAFEQPDLLVVYGSSEVRLTGIFAKYPTGFDVFRTGGAGTDCITYLEALAGVGQGLRGKKVVISLSPSQFFFPSGIRPEYYAGYFSRLHAYEVAFSTDLSMPLKQAVARRMLDFPRTVEADPILDSALQNLSDGSPSGFFLYYLEWPLGRFQEFILGLEDEWESLSLLSRHPELKTGVKKQPSPIDWRALVNLAEETTKQQATNNNFGFENSYWDANGKDLTALKGTESDSKFRTRMDGAQDWADLELLLRELEELGAEPMILSTPLPGSYYAYLGISAQGRAEYYQKLETLAKKYGASVVDFQDHEDDRYFLLDRWSHPSLKGAVYYQHALDNFYHGLPPALEDSLSTRDHGPGKQAH